MKTAMKVGSGGPVKFLSHALGTLAGMCIICDDGDADDVLFSIHSAVDRFGWSVQAVVDHDPPQLDWAYSIGLVGFGHPELVVVGARADHAALVINRLGTLIRAGQPLRPGCRLQPRDVGLAHGVSVGLVHPAHLEHGLMATWFDYYGSLGPPYPTPEALQIVLGSGCYCPDHRDAIPRLSNPKAQLVRQRPPPHGTGRRRAPGGGR
jgi:hypothetical protein